MRLILISLFLVGCGASSSYGVVAAACEAAEAAVEVECPDQETCDQELECVDHVCDRILGEIEQEAD